MAKLCMGCMNPLPEDSLECRVCGFDITRDKNPDHCLPITTSLQGHYIVGRLMGEFPDHLLYLAYDRQMREPCFIQEFFPAAISRRDSIGGIQPLEGCDKVFEEYADRFRTTMRILARMRELPSVVPVYDIFEESGTVYAVSDYCQGMTLTKKIKLSGGRIPWPEARSIFMSLLSGLIQLSDAGICHLAICPDNILIAADGKARLRNFSISSAHRAGTDLNADLKTGYAAPEQYASDTTVGAAADVYALAATIFRAVTGTEPPAGDNRAKNGDDLFMSAEVAEELTQPVCVALFNALQVSPERRTAGLAQLRDQLSITPQVSALVDEANNDIAQVDDEEPEEEKKSGKGGLIAALVVTLILLAGAITGIVLLLIDRYSNDSGNGTNKNGNSAKATVSTVSTAPIEEEPSKPNTGEVKTKNVTRLMYEDIKDDTFNSMPVELIGYDYDPGMAEGAVLRQYPPADTMQKPDSPIYVIVNKPLSEPAMVTIPDILGWNRANARVLLEQVMGLKVVKEIGRSNSTYEENTICSVSLGVNTTVERGSEVTLQYSTAKKALKVPNLAGASKTEVETTLKMMGFLEVIIEEEASTLYDAGKVVRIPDAGLTKSVDTPIVIYVSTGAPVGTDPSLDPSSATDPSATDIPG